MKVDQKAFLFLERVFFALCKGADSPVSLGAWLRFKNREFSQLVKQEVHPHHYMDRDAFLIDYQVVKFLSKYKDLDTGIDLEATALDSWKAAEISCAETNRRLRLGRVRGLTPRVEEVIFTARRKIASLLGPLDMVKVFESCGWGPGATYSLKGEDATLDDKIREFPINVTSRALPYIRAVVQSDPHWLRAIGVEADGPVSLLKGCFTTVRGCRATLVDKSAKTKRSIAIEPTGNIFLQLGMGGYLRRKLRRVGVDLNDQTKNQVLAETSVLEYFYQDLATVDLSSASDTVSRELVAELFPLDWFMLLDQLRSPELTWDGKSWLRLEKFSSMGNGFTFELESIIFWSLTSAVMEVAQVAGAIGIYGDDIICPTEVVPLLRDVLSECGFSFNREKSFWSGYFRESCGKHFWKGDEVTPVYQKESPRKLEEIYRLCNRLCRAALRSAPHGRTTRRSWVSPSWLSAVEGLCEYVHSASQRSHRKMAHDGDTWRSDAKRRGIGATSFEDVVLYLRAKQVHVVPLRNESDDGLMLPYRYLDRFAKASSPHGGLKLPVWTFRASKRKLDDHVALLAYWLRFGSEEPFKGAVTLRRRGSYRMRWRWFYDIAYVSDPSTLDVVFW